MRRVEPRHPPVLRQIREPVAPARSRTSFVGAEESEPDQRIVQLVGIGGLRPRLGSHARDRLGIKPADIRRGLGREPAPAHHRLGAALLQRGVIEIGIGARRQHLERQRRGLRQVAGDDFDVTRLDAREQAFEAGKVHRLVEAVADGLAHQRMIRDLAVAREVLGARDLIGKHRPDQVLGAHARELRRHLPAAAEARQRQRDADHPAPAGDEHRRIEHRLDQQRPDGGGMQVAGDLGELEAMRGGEREDDVVLGRRRLQLEIELAAKALAQRQAPGAVDAAAIGRMDDELHAADLVEKALEHDRLLRRQAGQRAMGRGEILGQLLGRGHDDTEVVHQPTQGILSGRIVAQARRHIRAQPRHRDRELVAAAGRLAQPERNGRRHAMGVLDPHHAALDAHDAIALVAELEDVAGEALDREILVHAADDVVLRLQQNLKVGVVRDRPARGQGGEPRPAPPAQHVVDGVVVDERAAPAAARAEAFRQHGDNSREILARQRAIGPRAADQREQLVLAPFLRRHLGHDLLRQHVERLLQNGEPVELAAADAVDERRAFHQLVAREREQPALGRARDRVPGSPDPLQERRDRARRAELADQVDLADVDAELERGGRHQRLELAVLEPLLGVEALLLGQAAVVRGHVLGADPLRQLARHPLRHPAGIDEDQRGAMRLDQVRETLIDLLPHLGRHHGFERSVRNLEREIARAAVAGIDDGAVGTGAAVRSRSDQKTRDLLDRLLRGGEADALQPVAAQRRQALERDRQMGAALVGRQCVDLVDDHGAGGREHGAARIPSRAGCKAIPAWSPRYAADDGACGRARRRACRRCAPRCGYRRRASPAPAAQRECRRAALRGCT